MSRLTLIAGAFPPELNPFEDFAKGKPQIRTIETGVGLIPAASGLTEALTKLQSEMEAKGQDLTSARLLFVGTVGALSAGVEKLSLVSPSSTKLIDVSTSLKKSYWPEVMVVEEAADSTMTEKVRTSLGGNFIDGLVYSPSAITFDPELAEYWKTVLGENAFESLELFAVAHVCRRFKLPWSAICAVTNTVGPGAHKEWKESHSAGAQKTFEALKPVLESAF